MDITILGTATDLFATAFFDNSGNLTGTFTTATATTVVLENGVTGAVTTFTGSGFTFSGDQVTGGTITGITFEQSGGTEATFTNFTWGAVDFVNALDALELGDETQLGALFDSAAPLNIDGSAATGSLDIDFRGLTGVINVTGGSFDDDIRSGSGNDSLAGGDGRDWISSGDGNDTLDASGGSAASQGWGDYLRPGLGADTVIGHAGLWATGEGTDLSYSDLNTGVTINVSGANGSGTVTGAGINDTFTYIHYFEGSQADDMITGSSEGHWEGFAPLDGNDTIDGGGGSGWNMADYSYEDDYGSTGGFITVDMAAGTVIDTFGSTDTLINIDEIRGTSGNDSMTAAGTADGFMFSGEDGNDTLIGGDGEDDLRGGNGHDYIDPGNSNFGLDRILAGFGNDQVVLSSMTTGFAWFGHWDLTGAINVTLDGNANTASILKAGNGTTTTITDIATPLAVEGVGFGGTSNADTFDITSTGFVAIEGQEGADSFTIRDSGVGGIVRLDYRWPGTGAIDANLATGQIVDGTGSTDSVSVLGGAAIEIYGTNFADTFTGTNGAFESYITGGGDDTVNGGDGWDVLRYNRNEAGAMDVDMAAGTASGTWEGFAFTDTFSGIEEVHGSRTGNDTIRGEAGDNFLNGRGGNDLLIGRFGDDTLRGEDGNDTLIGGDPDNLSNADGADHFDGGAGSDWVSYQGSFGSLRFDLLFPHINTFAAAGDTYNSIENAIGSQGADNMRGTLGDNHLIGDRNVDYIFGRKGNDTLEGGIGDDVLFGGVGQDVLIGGIHRDRAQYSESLTEVIVDLMNPGLNTGEAAGDTFDSIEDLAGSALADTLYGDTGDNRLFGREGNDQLYGRAGNDYLNGGANADRLDGGIGDDTMRGGTHNDTFIINGGDDVVEDFTYSHADRIAIDDDVITAVAGMNGAQIVSTFGSVVGGQVVLDFGAEGSVTIESLNTLAGLDTEVFVF